jgi:hypothetical protein
MYCNRCQKYHSNKQLDINMLIEKHASDIANHIDNLVIKELKAINKGASSMRDLKSHRKGDKGVK